MWIRVALDKSAIHGEPPGYVYVDGDPNEEYYFDENVVSALEADNFLIEMWEEFDALFDWGDCDFFFPDKCERWTVWLEDRLSKDCNNTIRPVFETMLDYCQKAVKYDTGVHLEF
jgi:hypothetical protein